MSGSGSTAWGTYPHPLRRSLEQRAREAGQGGMGYIEDCRLVQCLPEGAPMEMDVYDGAVRSAVADLSQRSINGRGRSVDVPDFTRAAWKMRPPLGMVTA